MMVVVPNDSGIQWGSFVMLVLALQRGLGFCLLFRLVLLFSEALTSFQKIMLFFFVWFLIAGCFWFLKLSRVGVYCLLPD